MAQDEAQEVAQEVAQEEVAVESTPGRGGHGGRGGRGVRVVRVYHGGCTHYVTAAVCVFERPQTEPHPMGCARAR